MAASGGGGGDYLYLTYLKDHNKPTRIPEQVNGFLNKFNQLCTLILGAYVCNVDLMGGLGPYGLDGAVGDSWTRRRRPQAEPERPEVEQVELAGRGLLLIGHLNHALRWLMPLPARRQLSAWRRQLKWGWLAYAVVCAYLALNLIILINIVHLYEYNIARLRLKRVRELAGAYGPGARVAFDDWSLVQRLMVATNYVRAEVNSTTTGDERGRQLELGEFGRILALKMDNERRLLAWLGDKFLQWGVVNECMYLFLLILCLCFYLIPQWIYRRWNQPDLQLYRDNVDYAGEQRRVDACCQSELLRYLESKRIYADLAREGIVALTSRALGAEDLLFERRLMRNHRASDQRATELLVQMFAAGALRPLNRSGAWIERRNLAQFALLCNIMFYCLIFDICVLYAPYQNAVSSARYLDLGESCGLVLVLIVDCAITHHFSTLVVACLDQALLVNRILNLIYECIRQNEREFLARGASTPCEREEFRSGRGGRGRGGRGATNDPDLTDGRERQQAAGSPPSVDKINSNLLFALLTYKIFVAQLVPFRRTLRGVFLSVFSISFIVPVLTRIHVPYLEQDTPQRLQVSGRQLRLIGFIIGSVILVPVNAVCLPLCYLHARCQKLYKALSSLMAHIAEMRKSSGGGGGGGAAGIYNEHAVSMLAKELANPKQMLEQFVVQSLWGGGTFPTLVKLHFWWGLVALSILLDTRGGRGGGPSDHPPTDEFFSSLFGDPLGVWCFHVV